VSDEAKPVPKPVTVKLRPIPPHAVPALVTWRGRVQVVILLPPRENNDHEDDGA